jgi:hypothetical protein
MIYLLMLMNYGLEFVGEEISGRVVECTRPKS